MKEHKEVSALLQQAKQDFPPAEAATQVHMEEMAKAKQVDLQEQRVTEKDAQKKTVTMKLRELHQKAIELRGATRLELSLSAYEDAEEVMGGYREQLAQLGLGLEDKMQVKVGALSGGQRQALSLLMSVMTPVEFLILDEHTAALDPKTAEKVLTLTDQLVKEHNLTTLMITHNMRDALRFGNRLIMMDNGKIIYDVKGDEKKNLTVQDLLERFQVGESGLSDRMMLGS